MQDAAGTFEVWQNPFRVLRVPYIFNLRTDPYERASITSNSYYNWEIWRTWALVPVQGIVRKFLSSFKDYPPRAAPASFTVGDALKKLEKSHGG